MKNNKGFTLVELLVVVAILAILAVAGMTALNPVEIMRKSNDSAAKTAASQIVSAYERAMTDGSGVTLPTNADNTEDFKLKVDYLMDTKGELKSNITKSPIYKDRTNYLPTATVDPITDLLEVCFMPQSNQMKTEAGTGTEDCALAEGVQCPVCIE